MPWFAGPGMAKPGVGKLQPNDFARLNSHHQCHREGRIDEPRGQCGIGPTISSAKVYARPAIGAALISPPEFCGGFLSGPLASVASVHYC